MTVVVNLYNNEDIDGILWGWAWGDGGAENLTFSFPTSAAGEYPLYESVTGFSAFNATQQAAATRALGSIASFCNLTFTLTTDLGAVMQFGEASGIDYTNDPTLGYAANHTPGNGTAEGAPPELEYEGNPPTVPVHAQGDTWYTNNYNNPVLGSFQYAAGIMHEIGHALGLKHGHVTQDGHGVTFPALPADHNSYEYSLMTYSQFPGDTSSGDNAPNHPTTYMQDDIAALQYLYGANYGASANNGNSTYTWSPTTGEYSINGAGQGAPNSNFVLMTIWDGGGTDIYDLSNYATDLSVDLNPGAWVVLDTTTPASAAAQRANLGSGGSIGSYFARGNIANALIDPNNPAETASLIENANGGSGNDTLLGNAVGNIFDGGGGDDTIDGRGGNDTAVYSGARSQYATSGSSGSVVIADQRSGTPNGTDTVSNVEHFQFSNRTYTLAEVLNQPPVLSPDAGPHPLSERLALSDSGLSDAVSGTLAFTDESGDAHTASASLSSASWSGGSIPGTTQTALASAMSASISLEAAAGLLAWDFSLVDRNVDFLALSETLTATYDVTIADQLGNRDTAPVTIVFTGANDAPVVVSASSDLLGSIDELPNVTGSLAIDSDAGVIAFSDPDLNDRPTATIGTQAVGWQDTALVDYTSELSPTQIAQLVAALGIAAQAGNTNSGSIDWSYDIADNVLDFLAFDESLTVTSEIVIDDHNGDTVNPDVVVTLYGANDAPIAAADSNGTAKNSILAVSAANGALKNDTDPDVHDQDDLFVSAVNGLAGSVGDAVAGTYGSLTLNADGSYVYAANKKSLPAQIVAQDTFNYSLADGHGGTDTSTLSFVVFNPGVSYQAGINTTLIGGNGKNVLDGSAGGDTLIGGNGADVLIGGDGDTLTGNNGPDTFLFRLAFGANIITDFDVHNDAIQFDDSLFTDVADILAHTTDTASGAVIDDGVDNTVLLVGVSLAELQAHTGDFFLA